MPAASPFIVHPLRTETLPPATHTNCVVAAGLWIVDPGTPYIEEIETLLDAIERSAILGIVLTHRHRDHVDGTNLLRARLGCPVYAHAITKEELAHKIVVDRTLEDEEPLDGDLRVLFTPGHARG